MSTPYKNELYKNIGQRIAELRRSQHLTQEALADSLDVSIKHISECERGMSCLSLEKLVQICKILSTDLNYLILNTRELPEKYMNIPPYIIDIFNESDSKQQELLQEYLLLFKKIYDSKE